jgi:hypothetical protein
LTSRPKRQASWITCDLSLAIAPFIFSSQDLWQYWMRPCLTTIVVVWQGPCDTCYSPRLPMLALLSNPYLGISSPTLGRACLWHQAQHVLVGSTAAVDGPWSFDYLCSSDYLSLSFLISSLSSGMG